MYLPTDIDHQIRERFAVEYIRDTPPFWSYMCNVKGADGPSYLRMKGFQRYGLFTKVGSLEDAAEDKRPETYETILYANPFAKKETFDQTAIQDAQMDGDAYGGLAQAAADFGESARETVDYYVQLVFENMFGSMPDEAGMVEGEDLPLVSASHTKSPTDSTTWSNFCGAATTETLNYDNLVEAHRRATTQTDAKGNRIGGNYNLILCGPSLDIRALELVATPAMPWKADNTLNVFGPQGMAFQRMVLPNITSYKWALVDPRRMVQSLIWRWVKPLQVSRITNAENRSEKIVADMRFAVGWRDPYWIYGSNATA